MPVTAGIDVSLQRYYKFLDPLFIDEYENADSRYVYLGNSIRRELPDVTNPETIVQFTIDKKGKATEVTILQGLDIIRPTISKIFNEMPAWVPLVEHGEGVDQFFVLRIVNKGQLNNVCQRVTDFIYSKIKFPPEAIRKKTSGRVWIYFVVDGNGAVSKTELVEGDGSLGDQAGCDAEVIRVIKAIPRELLREFSKTALETNFDLPVTFGNYEGHNVDPRYSGGPDSYHLFRMSEVFVPRRN
jgi:hypothetical protein